MAVRLRPVQRQLLVPGGPGGPGGRGGFGPGRFIAPGLFTATDADKDGSLTRAEFKDTFAKWFDEWDADKSGSLNVATEPAILNNTAVAAATRGGIHHMSRRTIAKYSLPSAASISVDTPLDRCACW